MIRSTMRSAKAVGFRDVGRPKYVTRPNLGYCLSWHVASGRRHVSKIIWAIMEKYLLREEIEISSRGVILSITTANEAKVTTFPRYTNK